MKDIPFTETLHFNDIDAAPGKGVRRSIPRMLTLEATNIMVKPDAPLHLDVTLRLVPGR